MRATFATALCLVTPIGLAACNDSPLADGSGGPGRGTGGSGSLARSCDTLSPTLAPPVVTLLGVDSLVGFKGSFRLKLTSRTADGWKATSDPAIPLGAEVDVDGGNLLDGFAVNDQLRVEIGNECPPFSGCWRWMVVKRDGDGQLISAWFNSFASQLAAFSDAVGATFKQGSAVCNAGEMCGPSTQTTVVVDGQPVIPTAEATVSLGNANYLVHVSSSFSPGAGADLSRCTDAGPLYATRVTLEVAGAAER